MELKTFKDIIDLTKNRIGETDSDTEIDIVLKGAVNHCYQNELGKIDKRIASTVVPIINGIATLPDDINSIESLVPPLASEDKRIGNAIVTSQTGSFNLVYSYLREPLVNDEDIPDMSFKYLYLLTTYGAYAYYKKKKKTDIANSYFGEYMAGVEALEGTDSVTYSVNDIYSTFGLGSDY